MKLSPIPRPGLALLVLLSLAGLSACGGSDSGPMGPDSATVQGTYNGTWTLRATEVGTGESVSNSCPGSVTISSQSGSSFQGSFIIRSTPDCDNVSGTVSGTLRSDGGVTLTIDVPGGNPDSFEDLTGCVILSGDSAFSGSIQGRSISFDASFVTDCFTEFGVFRLNWVLGFDGSR